MATKLDERNHYKNCLDQGQVYQDFVISALINHRGLVLSNFSSKLYQFNIGENFQGVEIKGDFPSLTTGNILIETDERTSKKKEWCKSGIYRFDNTKIYIVGNYSFFYLFDVKVLRREHKKMQEAKNGETENLKKFLSDTGRGFLWKIQDIEERQIYIDKIDCENDKTP